MAIASATVNDVLQRECVHRARAQSYARIIVGCGFRLSVTERRGQCHTLLIVRGGKQSRYAEFNCNSLENFCN